MLNNPRNPKVKVYSSLTLLIALALPISVHAGGDNGGGNGGGSIVCRDPNGVIKKTFMLDLWEGANLPRKDNDMKPLNIPEDDATPFDKQLGFALEKIRGVSAFAYEHVSKEVALILVDLNAKIIPIKMERVMDSNDFAVPEIPGFECTREQVAIYTKGHDLVIRKSIWDTFSQTAKAALILHEAIYKAERELKVKEGESSDHARSVVAWVFSSSPISAQTLGVLSPICKDLEFRINSSVVGALKPKDIQVAYLGLDGWAEYEKFPIGSPKRFCTLADATILIIFEAQAERTTVYDLELVDAKTGEKLSQKSGSSYGVIPECQRSKLNGKCFSAAVLNKAVTFSFGH